jgi:membrane-bound lytic murein transglycosylase B
MAARFGRRLRRGVTTTAVAAAAIAALSASGGPGTIPPPAGGDQAADATAQPKDDTAVSGDSSYHTDLPPLNAPDKPGTSIGLPANSPAEAGIPATVLDAYKRAEQTLAGTKPGCNLPWQLLAAIGKVESGQARGGDVKADGTTITPILGPVLNGVGFANISDTDDGKYDSDPVHDRAVGPMQFIPSTWATWGQDGNGDHQKDPNNIYDAALASGMYLCSGDRDLSVTDGLHQAILGYNHSQDYLDKVLSWMEYYSNGAHEVPDGSGVLPTTPGPSNPSPNPGPHPTQSTPPTTPPKPPKDNPGGGSSGPDSGGSHPSEPSKPGGGDEPGDGSSTPPDDPAPPVVRHLVNAGSQLLSAVAGTVFGQHAVARAEDADGKPVSGVKVQFAIVGDTDATFAGGAAKITVTTGKDGTANAPAVQAGERTGGFTVRATVGTKGVSALDYAATVTPRQADVIARTDSTALTAVAGQEFAAPLGVKATLKGAAAPNVAATATMVTSDTDSTVPAKGPYFMDAAGKQVRELTDLKTGLGGVLLLPKIYADDTTGTFHLLIRTEGGGTLTVDLTVTAAAQ